MIDYGPDSDGDYKVKFEDGERSGYVKADGLLGKDPTAATVLFGK